MSNRTLLYILIGVTFVLGVVSWYSALPADNYPGPLGMLWRGMDSLYFAMKLISGEFSEYALKLRSDPKADPPEFYLVILSVLRFVALLLAIFTVLYALFDGFRAWLRAGRRRWRRPEFDLVVGYGQAGRGIAQYLARDTGKRVLAICRDASDFARRQARDNGIELYASDAYELAHKGKLPFAPLAKARRIYVAIGSDTLTLAAADALAKVLPRTHRGRIWMHIENQRLLERLRDVPDPGGAEPAGRAQAFSLAEATAEYLVTRHRPMLMARASGQQRLHAVLVGFDNCAWNIVEQLVLAGSFPPPTYSRPRITIVDPEAQDAEKAWLARHAGLATWADIGFIQADPEAIAWTRKDELLERIDALDPPSLYIFARGTEALPHALALRHGMEKGLRAPARVVVVATARTEQALNFGQVPADMQDDLVLIGEAAEVASISIACNDVVTGLARKMHENYGNSPPFDLLRETLKVSNRRAALHAVDKLALLGFEQVRADLPCFGLSKPAAARLTMLLGDRVAMEHLAGFEHLRWCIDRMLEGWTAGERDDEARQRDQLNYGPLAYAELPDGERAKDREQLETVVRWLSDRAAGATGGMGTGAAGSLAGGPTRIVDLPDPARACWHRDDGILALRLDALIDDDALSVAQGEIARLTVHIPAEPLRVPGEMPNGRAEARRAAYAAFAAALAAQYPGLRFLLLRDRAEGWNWLGDVDKHAPVEGATLPPLTIGFAGPRDFKPTAALRRALTDIIVAQEQTGRPLRLVTGLAKGADALMISLCKDRAPILGIATGAEAEEAPQRALVDHVDMGAIDATGDDIHVNVARRIVDSCDVLIAIDDGSGGHGQGGTADTIRRAQSLGLTPIIVPTKAAPAAQ